MDNSRLQLVIKAIISVIVLTLVSVGEGLVILHGPPAGVNEILLGRILGTLDSAGLIILTYWFGSSTDIRGLIESVSKIGQTAAATPINIHLPDGTLLKSSTVATEDLLHPAPESNQSHM
jgi:hypothetical protein